MAAETAISFAQRELTLKAAYSDQKHYCVKNKRFHLTPFFLFLCFHIYQLGFLKTMIFINVVLTGFLLILIFSIMLDAVYIPSFKRAIYGIVRAIG